MMRVGSPMASCTRASLVLTVVLLSLSCCSAQIQCPDSVLTFNPDGSVDFGSLELPSGADPVDPSYNPGPAGGWYALAAGFVNVVRPGSLPYDQIRSTLSESGVQCSISANCTDNEGNFDVRQTLTSFATWWIGLIIVTIIGGLLGIAFCITGMCFCCCRCCGNCGGKKTQAFSDNMDCKTFTFTIILLLFLALLFAGVVLAFFSNQQTFDSIGNAQGSINTVVTDGTTYVNDTINELQQLVCQLATRNGVAGVVIREAEQFNTTLMDYVTTLENEVDAIGTQITFLAPGYNMTVEALTNLSSTSDALVMSGNNLASSIMSIGNRLDMIRMSSACMSLTTICGQLPPGSIFQVGADFTQLPNVTQELQGISDAIRNINFDNLVAEGRRTFEDIRQNINSTVASSIGEGISQIDSYNQSLFDVVDNLTSTVREYIEDTSQTCPPSFLDAFNDLTPNVGYIRQCVIDGAFDQVQQYDVYRYAFGIVICSLSLVTIVVALAGVVMGMCGFKKNKDPDQRSNLSHCGGIFLLLGVVSTFIFGFILLILCCIFFFFGSNAQKLCQAVEGPDYPLYTELIDNSSYWGGSLIGQYVGGNSENPPEIYISGVLNNCENNTGLFAAANLSFLLPAGSISAEISSRVNLNEIRNSVNGALTNATEDFNFNSTSFLPENVQNSLEEFRNSSVDQVNITAYREQIEAPLVMFNITEQIVILMDIRDSLMMAGAPAAAATAEVEGVIMELEVIRNTTIPAIQSQVNDLEEEVDMLVMLIDTVVIDTTGLVDTINEIIQNITGQSLPNFLNESVIGAIDGVFSLLDNSIQYVDNQLTNNVGACQPLWGIYTRLYNTVCRDFLQGLNGFWWSLGFCALMFIPVIIFSVLASNFYLKKKSVVDGYSGYDEFPMKAH